MPFYIAILRDKLTFVFLFLFGLHQVCIAPGEWQQVSQYLSLLGLRSLNCNFYFYTLKKEETVAFYLPPSW